LCFLIGNDFLPHISSLEIIEGGIETIIYYYNNRSEKGFIVNKNTLNLKNLKDFLKNLRHSEVDMIVHKGSCGKYSPDPLFMKHYVPKPDSKHTFDWESYRKDYYEIKLKEKATGVVKDYIKGLQWIITYYTQGVKNWDWFYPHYYAPLLTDLYEFIPKKMSRKEKDCGPVSPFVQLCMVLPSKKSHIVPEEIRSIYSNKEYYPDSYKVDESGIFKEWEAILKLPFIDKNWVESEVSTHLKKKYRNNSTDRTRSYVYNGKMVLYKYL
jgi:5'-3' exonuclease